jgi:hypothetical protein
LQQTLVAGLGVASIVLSWFTVHTLFTVRYARLYYTSESGGVDFHPGRSAPLPRLRLPRVHDRHDVPGFRHRSPVAVDPPFCAPPRLAVLPVRCRHPRDHDQPGGGTRNRGGG